MINKQNDRVVSFGQDISSHLHSSTTKHPASLMMLGVIVSTGDKMPPVWFKTGYRLKGEDYKEILKTKVLPWIKKIAKKRNCRYVFQQDGTPAHTSKIVQSWMTSNMNFWKKIFGLSNHLISTRLITVYRCIFMVKPVRQDTQTQKNLKDLSTELGHK